ncbi:substrate-binding domain-containing protein [Vibrio sp. SS-MA-C1-2]|uniref:LacI family DNA-binding transcriptional regulator n=1 Tax=Vibrio sp. SS-MA-C1-2 TaxID=2908646 RepID=UPI001F29D9C8|nr:substrate-binding domain-containing protein [Vibrio sp. SS-MA-C1-2]UJF18532.1 substrate-binding domain-containing protein [Vibrio sp. SS-MA-C1-2]
MTTIKKVAQRAGVSTATVSRVINGSSKVLFHTVDAVEQAMKEVGYTVSGNQRLTINQSSDTVGLVISKLNSPFYGLLSQGVEKVVKKHNKMMLVINTNYIAEEEINAIEFLLSKGCKNIILHSKGLSDSQLIEYAKKIPTLTIVNRYIKQIEKQCVWLDNSEGTYLATLHLIEQGHTRIAYISCEAEIDDKTLRFDGYCRALESAGLTVNPDWVEEAPFGDNGGVIAASNLLNKGLPVTAIVSYNDYFAAAAMQVFKSHDIDIPNEISIVGFDDILPQCYFSPALTTIRNPIESMASNATLISLNGFSSEISREFHPILIKRDSVKRVES